MAQPEFKAWDGIIQRCTNPNSEKFKDYGGRGITVCDRWRSFANFFADMGPRPPGVKGKLALYSIERIDNNKGYEPGNCRWATQKEQARNKRRRIDSRFTPEQIQAIRADNRTHRAIAADYGVGHSHIGMIKRGEIHVEDETSTHCADVPSSK